MENKSKSIHELYYHVVFVVKYRKKLLTGKIEQEVKDSLLNTCKNLNIDILEMESDMDHIHLLIRSRPDLSISNLIKQLKKNSTNAIWSSNHNYMKTNFWKNKILWTRSYFVGSVGITTKEIISKYVSNQKINSSTNLKGMWNS